MYFKYIKERLGKDSIQYEDKAFAIFFDYPAENAIYVEDVYVSPDYRRSGIGEKIMEDMCNLAKEANRKYLLGSVDITSNNPEASLIGMLKNDFKLYKTDDSMLYVRKEI